MSLLWTVTQNALSCMRISILQRTSTSCDCDRAGCPSSNYTCIQCVQLPSCCNGVVGHRRLRHADFGPCTLARHSPARMHLASHLQRCCDNFPTTTIPKPSRPATKMDTHVEIKAFFAATNKLSAHTIRLHRLQHPTYTNTTLLSLNTRTINSPSEHTSNLTQAKIVVIQKRLPIQRLERCSLHHHQL